MNINRRLLAAAVLVFALASGVAAHAQGGAVLRVDNQTSSYITVSVDGAYGCNTASMTTCTIPVTVGRHHLRAVATDSGASVERDDDIDEGGAVWTITEGAGGEQAGGQTTGPVQTQSTVLKVDNQTSSYVTVTVDGAYGCNTAPQTYCTIPITVGAHHFRAVRTDSGFALERDGEVDESGAVWTLTDVDSSGQ